MLEQQTGGVKIQPLLKGLKSTHVLLPMVLDKNGKNGKKVKMSTVRFI